MIDPSEVTMDSTGLNALVIGYRATRGTPGWIRLAQARPCVLRVLRLSGPDAFIDCYPTRGAGGPSVTAEPGSTCLPALVPRSVCAPSAPLCLRPGLCVSVSLFPT
ncbi:STAS domain-containing protein [Streptomyces minutiscleroticus]|nr:STAS domain-containing protein [Streptomyces minutiscleroticus]